MTDLSMAFMVIAVISGTCLLGVVVNAAAYNYGPPKGHTRWLKILFVATVVFAFTSVMTNHKSCSDYEVADYEYGRVPVSCSREEQ